MTDDTTKSAITRRELLGTIGKAAAASVALGPLVRTVFVIPEAMAAGVAPLTAVAGVDRIAMLPGKTYLNAWAGYGDPPRLQERRRGEPAPPPPSEPPGPAPTVAWSRESGPGTVTFADPRAPVTTATFSAPGAYVLKLTVDNGQSTVASTLNVDPSRSFSLFPQPGRIAPIRQAHISAFRMVIADSLVLSIAALTRRPAWEAVSSGHI